MVGGYALLIARRTEMKKKIEDTGMWASVALRLLASDWYVDARQEYFRHSKQQTVHDEVIYGDADGEA